MNEKQLARYLRAVRRRLSLSGQMKDRVMDDLRSSINERREAGQTDAEIFAALGPAKQAAAELTAQLPGYAFRKSPLRFVCLGAAVLALLAGLLKTVTHLRGFASVGVIGGADGPVAIVTGGTAHGKLRARQRKIGKQNGFDSGGDAHGVQRNANVWVHVAGVLFAIAAYFALFIAHIREKLGKEHADRRIDHRIKAADS